MMISFSLRLLRSYYSWLAESKSVNQNISFGPFLHVDKRIFWIVFHSQRPSIPILFVDYDKEIFVLHCFYMYIAECLV
jgi:hypothetical protein